MSDSWMRSILLFIIAVFVFCVGHYVGFERALTQKFGMPYALTIGPVPTSVQLGEWSHGEKFVIGHDGKWEKRAGRCTDEDLNCMD